MRLIDNKKDYYDYMAGVYGIDDYITYDRRNSVRLYNPGQGGVEVSSGATVRTADQTWPHFAYYFCDYKNGAADDKYSTYGKEWDTPKMFARYSQDRSSYEFNDNENFAHHKSYLGLLIGLKLYVIEVHRILKNESDKKVAIVPYLVKTVDYPVELRKNSAPIVISEVSIDWGYSWKRDKLNNEKITFTWNENQRLNYKSYVPNPIMSGTWIPKIISAETVWNNVTDYLLACKEKPFIDKRTDVEHLESAGFDKKTSFRNM